MNATAGPNLSRNALILNLLARIAVALCVALGAAAASAADAGRNTAVDIGRSAAEIERVFSAGDTARAWRQIDEALAARPGDASLWFQKGLMLLQSQRPAEAIAVYQKLIQEFPELAEAYNNLAVLQADAGDLALARDLLQAALRNDPGYRTARENLGDVYIRLAVESYELAARGVAGLSALERKLRLARELSQAR